MFEGALGHVIGASMGAFQSHNCPSREFDFFICSYCFLYNLVLQSSSVSDYIPSYFQASSR